MRLAANVGKLRSNLAEIKEKQVDLQARSMRDKLIFYGIEETVGEDQQSCEDKLRTFIAEKLQITKLIDFHRVHRLGEKTPGKSRSIVAKFVNYKDRELVRHSAFLALKGPENRGIGINEHFPREINERRKSLWPHYKEAKRLGKRAFMAYDKLYVDGELFTLDQEMYMEEVAVLPDEERNTDNKDQISLQPPKYSHLNRTLLMWVEGPHTREVVRLEKGEGVQGE
ncbi:hypothetical protein FSP39_008769 [Pinctada imbricata]|uniref:Uncharacterized protein n=1 Tax=Pinctada imbricata TaxID=66713 RepID=A0AA89BWU2_PINIB|nr:hypothetical protein FSP39_008769 [Pinctada imbricata]